MRKAPSYSLIREAQINAFLILLGARLQILSKWIQNSSPIVASPKLGDNNLIYSNDMQNFNFPLFFHN